jgi:hypothetical protein
MKVHRKVKNGYEITLQEWTDEVVVTEIATGKVVGRQTFSDYIKAYLVWQKL